MGVAICRCRAIGPALSLSLSPSFSLSPFYPCQLSFPSSLLSILLFLSLYRALSSSLLLFVSLITAEHALHGKRSRSTQKHFDFVCFFWFFLCCVCSIMEVDMDLENDMEIKTWTEVNREETGVFNRHRIWEHQIYVWFSSCWSLFLSLYQRLFFKLLPLSLVSWVLTHPIPFFPSHVCFTLFSMAWRPLMFLNAHRFVLVSLSHC